MSETMMKTTDALREAAQRIEQHLLHDNPLTPTGVEWVLKTIRNGAEQLEKFQDECFAYRRNDPPAEQIEKLREYEELEEQGRLVILNDIHARLLKMGHYKQILLSAEEAEIALAGRKETT